jgi:histidine triad (HIT) family protein
LSDCLFCKILLNEVPSQKVAENEKAYAFEDINPTAPCHVLVVPKKHIENAGDIRPGDEIDLLHMFLLAQEIAELKKVSGSGYRLVFNVGDDALNSVGHLHLHVIGGRKMGWPPG